MHMKIITTCAVAALSLVAGLTSCRSVPFTDRPQLMLTSEAEEAQMGLTAFSQYKSQYNRSANGTRGLQTDINNYLALVPQLIFDEGKVREINIQPIALNFHAENKELLKGLPTVADEESARRIYDLVAGLSREYNTELKLENGLIKVVL